MDSSRKLTANGRQFRGGSIHLEVDRVTVQVLDRTEHLDFRILDRRYWRWRVDCYNRAPLNNNSYRVRLKVVCQSPYFMFPRGQRDLSSENPIRHRCSKRCPVHAKGDRNSI